MFFTHFSLILFIFIFYDCSQNISSFLFIFILISFYFKYVNLREYFSNSLLLLYLYLAIAYCCLYNQPTIARINIENCNFFVVVVVFECKILWNYSLNLSDFMCVIYMIVFILLVQEMRKKI